jgi:hypothetical protein
VHQIIFFVSQKPNAEADFAPPFVRAARIAI